MAHPAAAPVHHPSAHPTGIRRSWQIFQAMRREQTDPNGTYSFLAEDTTRMLGRYLPLAGATAIDVGGGPGYTAEALRAAGASAFTVDPFAEELSLHGRTPVDAVVGDGMTAVTAAGLGGGSLIYQGMSLQPARDVFNEHLPESLDWGLLDRVYYPRVVRMLGLATAPDSLVRRPEYRAARIFADHARRAGLPVSKIPMPIDWRYAQAEIDGKMTASYTDGCDLSAASTSSGYTFSPPVLMTCDPRPRSTMVPSSPTVAMSPVSTHRLPPDSTNVAADFSGSL